MESIGAEGPRTRHQKRRDCRSPAKGSTKSPRRNFHRDHVDEVVALSDTNATDGDRLRTSAGENLYGRPTPVSLVGAGQEDDACLDELQHSIRRRNRGNPSKWGKGKRKRSSRSFSSERRVFRNAGWSTLIPSDRQKLEKNPPISSSRRGPRPKRRDGVRVIRRLQSSEGLSCEPTMITNDSTLIVARMGTCPRTLPSIPLGPETPVPVKQKRSAKRKKLESLGDVHSAHQNLACGQQAMTETHEPARRKLSFGERDSEECCVDIFWREKNPLEEQEVSATLPQTIQVQSQMWASLKCMFQGKSNDYKAAQCGQMLNKSGLSAACEQNISVYEGVSSIVHLQENILNSHLLQLPPHTIPWINRVDSPLLPSTPVKFSVPKKSRSSVPKKSRKVSPHVIQKKLRIDLYTGQETCLIPEQPLSAIRPSAERHEILSIAEQPISEAFSNAGDAGSLKRSENLKTGGKRGDQEVLLDLNQPPSQISDEPIYIREEPPGRNGKRPRKKHPRPKVLEDKPVRVPKTKKAPNPRKAQNSKPSWTKKSDSQAAQMKQQGVFQGYNGSESQVEGRVPEHLYGEDALTSQCKGRVPEHIFGEDAISSVSKPQKMKAAARSRRSRVSIQTVESLALQSVAVGFAELKLLNTQTNTAIVLHSSSQRAIVPHLKLRLKAQKPKVQLGDDDLQWWKLVMTHGPTYEDRNDEETEKKWAKQRMLFKMRADNFIQVMHAVQGNRRFSKWKGSVIDSVVGAFLTQNVSDHLSSSAFMLLASKFPIPSSSEENSFKEVSVEETFDPGESYTDATPLRMRDADKGYLVEEPTTSEDPSIVQEPPIVTMPSTVEDFEEEHKDFWHSPAMHSGEEAQCNHDYHHRQVDHSKTHVVNSKISGDFKIRDELGVENPSVPSAQQEAEGTDPFIPNGPEEAAVENPAIEPARSIETGHIPSENLPDMKEKKEKVSYIGLTGSERARLEQNKTKSKDKVNWEEVRKSFAEQANGAHQNTMKDAVDWETVRDADVDQIADVIKERGMNNMLAGRIKGFLNRVQIDHGSLDLEWLRTIPPEQAKKFLLSIHGLGLKSAECVRLLTLHHLAFPVDTNVGRICVRLGWVPIEPLPEVKLLSELETYPVQENIQKYLWPRLCTLDQLTLYELHYQMITFGKVFCTKRDPNCNACPLRNDCRHYADAMTRSRRLEITSAPHWESRTSQPERLALPAAAVDFNERSNPHTPGTSVCEPIIEEPSSPVRNSVARGEDLVDFHEDGRVPEVILHPPEFLSQALVVVPPDVAAKPVPKLKSVGRLRTVHYVYELNDDHDLLSTSKIARRVEDDPCPILLAIWGPGESPDVDVPTNCPQDNKMPETFAEGKERFVKGTFLVPCRTANRGSFPLNGTYFQVNEVFADHETSINPVDVPRKLLWNLTRRFVYFGTSVTSIFKGLNVEEISHAFQFGYVCVRGFDSSTRAPKPLQPRLHSAARLVTKRRQQQPEGNREENGYVGKAPTKRKQNQKVTEEIPV